MKSKSSKGARKAPVKATKAASKPVSKTPMRKLSDPAGGLFPAKGKR